ncbi:MAG: hypothetical protein DRJ40_01900 [Thermoprotei archaeon]|nr:MAG: hypothetical protein DRJ40_01900 [Thermoprotei archaeon]
MLTKVLVLPLLEVYSKVYEYLLSNDEVMHPGSVRSYIYATVDTAVALLLDISRFSHEEYSVDKMVDTIVRTAVANLASSVRVSDETKKREIIEEAVRRALGAEDIVHGLQSAIKKFLEGEKKSTSSQDKQRSLDKLLQSLISLFEKFASELEKRFRQQRSSEEPSEIDNVCSGSLRTVAAPTQQPQQSDLDQCRRSYSAITPTDLSPEVLISILREARNIDEMKLYEIVYGYGMEEYPNIAQLINMLCPITAPIGVRLEIARRIVSQLKRIPESEVAFLEQALLKRSSQRVSYEKKLNELTKVRLYRHLSSITTKSAIKKERHYMSKVPTSAIAMVRHYEIGDSSWCVDVMRTSMNIVRKQLTNRPITSRDVVVYEYLPGKQTDTIICLDVSGSMREFCGVRPKIEIAKEALARYIQYLVKSDDKLALILFNYRADLLWNLLPVKKYWKKMVSLLTHVWAAGGTNMYAALKLATNVLKRSRSTCRHVVCITDGRTLFTNLCLAQAKYLHKRGVTISVVAVGDYIDEKFLQKVSKIGGGAYYHISTMDVLADVLKDIRARTT